MSPCLISPRLVYQNITFQYAMIEHQVHLESSASNVHHKLAPHEGKPPSEFQ